jgi:peptidoglycan hydrolase-like protein with peptidoglycan-binding domain
MAEKDVDGKYGPKTTKAVKAYQKKQGLAIDGQVGIKTWNRMF